MQIRWRVQTTLVLIASLGVLMVSASLAGGQPESHHKQAIDSTTGGQKKVQPSQDSSNSASNAQPPQPQPSKSSVVWSISPPPERLRLPTNRETQFTVSASGEIDDLRLLQSTLQDTSSLVQLDATQITLCAKGADNKCESPIDVKGNSIRPVSLTIDPAFDCPGVFTGEVRFGVKDQSETKSFKLTVYSRPLERVALGVLAIAVGLLTYFLTHVWLRVRLARDEALLPVYELRETIDALQMKIAPVAKQTAYVFGGFEQVFSSLQTQLSNQQIVNYLPPAFPKPGAPSDDWVSGFKANITPLRDRIAGLVVLTNSGLLQAAPYWSTNQGATKTALAAIDGLAGTVTNADVAQAKLAPIIQTLVGAINQPAAQALAPFLAAPIGLTRFFTEPPDEQSLRVDLYRSTLGMWTLWMLIALIAGIYVLIISSLGFGTYADIVKCFFWGLGFSVAGGQLEQMTLSTVTGSFGISIPKA
jgi:hypothetical protein